MAALMPMQPSRHQSSERQELGDVREGRRHHRGPGFGQRGVDVFEVDEGGTEGSSRLDDVVHPGAHGDQVRPHLQGQRKLLVADFGDPLAADREVGVVQARIQRIDHDGEPVGESEQADGIVTVP